MIAAILVDGRDRYEVRFDTEAWTASCEWARFHGIDPNRVPAGSTIERDAARRCIRYSSFVPTGPGVSDIQVIGDEPVVVDRIEQGEAIKPFPAEVTA